MGFDLSVLLFRSLTPFRTRSLAHSRTHARTHAPVERLDAAGVPFGNVVLRVGLDRRKVDGVLEHEVHADDLSNVVWSKGEW